MHKYLILLMVLVLSACGGDSDSPEPESPQNLAPKVTISNVPEVTSETEVTLTANATDSDGSVASYSWEQVSGPTVTLNNAGTANASFSTEAILDSVELTFKVTVTDNEGATTESTVNVTVTLEQQVISPDQALHSTSSFYAGQYVLFQSSAPIPDEPFELTDPQGQIISVSTQQNGMLFTQLSQALSLGESQFRAKAGGNVWNLTLDVQSAPVIAQPRTVIDDSVSSLIEVLENTQLSFSSRDPNIDALINSLENLSAEFDGLNESELQHYAGLLQSLGIHRLTEEFSPKTFAGASCTAITTKMTVAASLWILSAGAAAVEPSNIAKLLFVAASLTGAYKFMEWGERFFDQNCLGIAQFYQANVNSNAGKTIVDPSVLLAKALPGNALVWFDNETKPVTVTYTNQLPAVLQSQLAIIHYILTLFGDYAPADILTRLTALQTPRNIDLSDEVLLTWTNTETAQCSGDTSALQCGFPMDQQTYSQSQTLDISVSHPDITLDGEFVVQIQPRDVPALQNQSFSVVAGPGIVNRLEIAYEEDTESPNYELTRITEFELVSGPAWGVILNEFNEFAVLDYAADLGADMPEQETITIRARNRYGWSETVEITLILNGSMPPDLRAYYTNTVVYVNNADPIELRDDNDNVYASMGCAIEEYYPGATETYQEDWLIDAENNQIRITYYDEDSGEASIVLGDYDPSTNSFVYSDDDPRELVCRDGNENCVPDESIDFYSSSTWELSATLDRDRSTDDMFIYTGAAQESNTTSWDVDGRSVTCVRIWTVDIRAVPLIAERILP